MIASILASTSSGGIGNKRTLPWPKHDSDMAWFKKHTTNNIVVMGRNTWDDPLMPKPLPNRINLVATSRRINEATIVGTINGDVNQKLKDLQAQYTNKNIFVIGGKQLYESTINSIERVYLTRMQGNYWADTRIDLDRYLSCFRIYSVRPGPGCTFEIWDRKFF